MDAKNAQKFAILHMAYMFESLTQRTDADPRKILMQSMHTVLGLGYAPMEMATADTRQRPNFTTTSSEKYQNYRSISAQLTSASPLLSQIPEIKMGMEIEREKSRNDTQFHEEETISGEPCSTITSVCKFLSCGLL